MHVIFYISELQLLIKAISISYFWKHNNRNLSIYFLFFEKSDP